MSPEIQNRIVGVVGRKGTGKSSLLVERLQTRNRILVFDPMAEHDWLPNELGGEEALRDFFKWNRKREQWAAQYVPGEDLEEDLETVCEVVYDRGSCDFGIEEIPLICRPNYLPRRLGKLIRTGRHRLIDVTWTAQRAGEVSRTLTSLTDEFVFFSQTEPRDLDAIADRCGSPIAERVAQLGPHDHFAWDVARRQVVDGRPTGAPPAGG